MFEYPTQTSPEYNLYSFLQSFHFTLVPQNNLNILQKKNLLLKCPKMSLKEEVGLILGKGVTEKEGLRMCIDFWINSAFDMPMFSKFAEFLYSKDRFLQHLAAIGIRKLLSAADAPIAQTIDSGIIPRLISLLEMEEEPHLQLEVAWILTNVTSGTTEQTRMILNKGLHRYVKLLRHAPAEIQEQIIWLFGNISGDSAEFRDAILKANALEAMLKFVDSTDEKLLIKNGTWAISNLCRGKPLPNIEYVICAIPTLIRVIEKENDSEVLQDACWALNYLTESGRFDVNTFQDNFIERLTNLLKEPFAGVSMPSLQALRNICHHSSTLEKKLISRPEFIHNVYQLFHCPHKSIRREALSVVSNLSQNWESGEKFFDEPGLIETCIVFVLSDKRKESLGALSILGEFVLTAELPKLKILYGHRVLNSFLHAIQQKDKKLIFAGLKSLKYFLKKSFKIDLAGQNLGEVCIAEIKECGALNIIKQLQKHSNDEKIKLKATKVLLKMGFNECEVKTLNS